MDVASPKLSPMAGYAISVTAAAVQIGRAVATSSPYERCNTLMRVKAGRWEGEWQPGVAEDRRLAGKRRRDEASTLGDFESSVARGFQRELSEILHGAALADVHTKLAACVATERHIFLGLTMTSS